MDKIFRLTKVTKFSDGDENFVLRKILSDIVLSDKVFQSIKLCGFSNSLQSICGHVPVYLFLKDLLFYYDIFKFFVFFCFYQLIFFLYHLFVDFV